MKRVVFFLTVIFCTRYCFVQGQTVDLSQTSLINVPNYDSLEKLLTTVKADTAGVNTLGMVSFFFAFYRPERGVIYGQRGLQLANELSYKEGIAYCNQSLGICLWGIGNYNSALQAALNSLRIYEDVKDRLNIAFTYYVLANIYRDFGDYKRALEAVQNGFALFQAAGKPDIIGYANMGAIYDLMEQTDSARHYVRIAVEMNQKINNQPWGWLSYLQGNIHRKTKQYDSAMYYYRNALLYVEEKDIVETYNGIAILYRETGQIDSSIFYATEVLDKWKSVAYQRGILQAANILVDAYKKRNERDSVIKYLTFSVELNNKLYNQENERDIQNLSFNEQTRQDEIVRDRQRLNSQLKLYLVILIGIIFLGLAIMFWRNNRQRKKAYTILQKQKQETDYQRTKAEATLEELEETQAQLIQSAKMASLGELMAGIAHEIQNPLNFVNNFSEINTELIEELRNEKSKVKSLPAGQAGEKDEQVENELLNDIAENEKKINHHGKRADAIVKGMLQHSRSNAAIKELTDINKLADEYLQLAYHGLRAKDKSFNATMETSYDQSIGNLAIVPQDIGRSILNLITNAFYAIAEKRKQVEGDYNPTVIVSTKKMKNHVEISVKDNGLGISPKIIDKIFQPFFTTKPTGQGTGLGLSLSYDIVKAHGGELNVKSIEGDGSEFVMILPFKQASL